MPLLARHPRPRSAALPRPAGALRSARALRALGRDRRGGVVLVLALLLPVLLAATDAAIEYGHLVLVRARVQKAADAGALAGGREMMLANNTDDTVTSAARGVVLATLATEGAAAVDATRVRATIGANRRTVTVEVTRAVGTLMGRVLSLPTGTVGGTASATVFGEMRLCLLTLDPAGTALRLDMLAQVTASNCAVYANSADKAGITVQSLARISAQLVCSVGGYAGLLSVVTPLPSTGCPAIADPLAKRAAPSAGGCDYTDLTISGSTRTLSPGVYCGGLKVTKGAAVTLQAGTYVIDGGPLTVDGDASFQGDNVGLYFRGDKATLDFRKDSTISLSAPKVGDMAGLLMFEDRGAPKLRQFRIQSNNARRLLGTIYLSQGYLQVDADKPVGDLSAYTVIVVRQMRLEAGPNLVMNASYGTTDVPVPDGVGPRGGTIALTQ